MLYDDEIGATSWWRIWSALLLLVTGILGVCTLFSIPIWGDGETTGLLFGAMLAAFGAHHMAFLLSIEAENDHRDRVER